MAAAGGLLQFDMRADIGRSRQMDGRQKRVIFRVDRKSRHLNRLQPRFGRGALPVVIGTGKTMHRSGYRVVELVQVDCLQHAGFVEQAGELAQTGGRDCLQCFQEMLRIDTIEPTRQMVAAGGKIERGTDGGDAGDQFGSCGAAFAGPFEQGIAAQRNASGVQRPSLIGGVKAAQDPVDFIRVAGVVSPWPAVQLAGTAAEMR